ncbi:MAG: hypothetical protein KC713_06350, partial [Candidatus Omnitrophica bacterium]|nr:hypothetical protein [Candidatus Omnitrophota bacterium]
MGNFYVFSRATIREMRSFSIYIPGPPPIKLNKSTRQKRIDSESIAYDAGGLTKCRFLHVDARGKNMAGRIATNFVNAVSVKNSVGGNASEFGVEISMADPKQLMVFSFFDFQGHLIVQKTVDLSSAKIKKGKTAVSFEIEGGIALEQCGLLEIY